MTKNKKLLELLKTGDSDKLSSSVLWFHIANIAVTIVYVLLGIAAFNMDEPNIEGMAVFTAVYAGIATSNKFANSFLNYKYTTTKESLSKKVINRDDNVEESLDKTVYKPRIHKKPRIVRT